MKKTLIALAAVAVSGSAFAANHAAAAGSGSFVKFSGKFGTSINRSTLANFAAPTNIGVTDGDLRVDAVEDLGGGLKAFAAMELRVRGRGAADEGGPANTSGVGGRNATVGLDSASIGALAAGAIEFGNGLKGRAWAGAPIGIAYALENDAKGLSGPLGNSANVDTLIYTTPQLLPGLVFMYIKADSITAPSRLTKGLSVNAYQVHYDNGPLGITADYSKFDNDGTLAGGVARDRSRVRVAASYNFGPFAAGIGYEDNSKSGVNGVVAYPNDASNYTAGVRVPLGAVTLGAVWAHTDATAAQTNNARSGYAFAVQYDFSKRTNVNWTVLKQTEAADAGNEGTRHQLRLMHSF